MTGAKPASWNAALPARTVPLRRGSGLQSFTGPERRTRIKPVSAKRVAENRERRAMARTLWPELPPCPVPWCGRIADDLHEILSRAQGGSITDPENCIPLCSLHHDEITFFPESKLEWAYALGFLKHSRDADGGSA